MVIGGNDRLTHIDAVSLDGSALPSGATNIADFQYQRHSHMAGMVRRPGKYKLLILDKMKLLYKPSEKYYMGRNLFTRTCLQKADITPTLHEEDNALSTY